MQALHAHVLRWMPFIDNTLMMLRLCRKWSIGCKYKCRLGGM